MQFCLIFFLKQNSPTTSCKQFVETHIALKKFKLMFSFAFKMGQKHIHQTHCEGWKNTMFRQDLWWNIRNCDVLVRFRENPRMFLRCIDRLCRWFQNFLNMFTFKNDILFTHKFIILLNVHIKFKPICAIDNFPGQDFKVHYPISLPHAVRAWVIMRWDSRWCWWFLTSQVLPVHKSFLPLTYHTLSIAKISVYTLSNLMTSISK